MNSIRLLFLNCAVAVLSFNQFTTDTEQWKSINLLGAEQSREQSYNQVLKQYINYYNYLYQQNFLLNNQNNNVNINPIPTTITNVIPTNITNVIPTSAFKMENRSKYNEQPTVRPKFPQKNKVLLLTRRFNTQSKKPLKSKIISILCKA